MTVHTTTHDIRRPEADVLCSARSSRAHKEPRDEYWASGWSRDVQLQLQPNTEEEDNLDSIWGSSQEGVNWYAALASSNCCNQRLGRQLS